VKSDLKAKDQFSGQSCLDQPYSKNMLAKHEAGMKVERKQRHHGLFALKSLLA
jgi:hypothetical protein